MRERDDSVAVETKCCRGGARALVAAMEVSQPGGVAGFEGMSCDVREAALVLGLAWSELWLSGRMPYCP